MGAADDPRQLRDRGRNAISPAKREGKARSRVAANDHGPIPGYARCFVEVAKGVSRGITQKYHTVALGPVKGTLVIDVSYDHGAIR